MRSQDEAAAQSDLDPTPTNRWPFQVKFILGNEAAERFSYYGMKGILALYITSVLLKTKDDATNIIHLFGFTNYFMPLIGAWVSDRFWGRYRTILWISLSYCVGHGVMALSDAIPTVDGKVTCLYVGLGLIAFGSGGIKPCVSAFMGDQFRPEQKHLLQKAYAAFYWSINLGSTASFLLIPFLRKQYGYSWAFGVPGIAMALATFIFWLGTKHYVMVPPSRKTRSAGFFKVFLYALKNQKRRQSGQLFWDVARNQFTEAEVDAAKSVGPILSIFALAPIFWSLFDQTFSTWVLQGEKMIPYKIGNYTVGPEEMLSANPILVMILVPIMTWWLYPMLGKLATPLRRMSAGMFLSAFSFVVVAMMQKRLDAGETYSVLWQFVPYVIITIAEVLFSTTGLEFAFREAAPSMKSTIMGFWQLTVALGNLLVSVLTTVLATKGGGHADSVSVSRFMLYAAMTFVVAILFSIVASFYRYRDPAAAQGR
jgi:proton-dependent oligopeptide transporter, POT family